MFRILLCLSFLVSTVVLAESKSKLDKQLSKILAVTDKCFERAVSTVEMKECAGEQLVSSDLLLNQVYKERVHALKSQVQDEKGLDELSRSGEETLKRLVAAQKAWIVFRDADCSLQAANMLNGTGEGLIELGCLAKKTFDRVKEISTDSTELEGDVAH